jgi:hypothetical protein
MQGENFGKCGQEYPDQVGTKHTFYILMNGIQWMNSSSRNRGSMTIIVADTTCGLPRDLLTQRGIPLIPQVVMFGEEAFHDDKELDTSAFLQKLKAAKELPKTAAPEPPCITRSSRKPEKAARASSS